MPSLSSSSSPDPLRPLESSLAPADPSSVAGRVPTLGSALAPPQTAMDYGSLPPSEVLSQCIVPRSQAEVFDFCADARNLNAMTPGWLSFHIRSPQPILMQLGTEIDYWMLWRGVPVRWRSRVIAWQPPLMFTYEQVRGPYRRFVHEHRYESCPQGTQVTDRVWWSVAAQSVLGSFVARDLHGIFAHREQALVELLAGGVPSTA